MTDTSPCDRGRARKGAAIEPASAHHITVQGSANAKVVVEVAVDSLAGARAAAHAGADRLEVCSSLAEGGLTPSLGLFEAVRAAVQLPIFAMVRPRGGDFLYDDDDFDIMLRDLRLLRGAGADGIVSGALVAAGGLDEARLAELVARTHPLPFTCHRAFDLCADPAAAIETLVQVGAARVLTSGQAPSAPAGAPAIARHVAAAGSRLVVMAGAGVRDDNIRPLVAATGVREVHLSAGVWRASGMRFQRRGVRMGPSAPPEEHSWRATDGTLVAAVVEALRRH